MRTPQEKYERTRAQDRARSRRPDGTGPRVISFRDLVNGKRSAEEEAAPKHRRPKKRAECATGTRPCPYVSCQYNLYLDVTRTGSIRINFPDREPDEMEESCVLDVVDKKGALTLEQMGKVLNLTRERVRQLESIVLRKFGGRVELLGIKRGYDDK